MTRGIILVDEIRSVGYSLGTELGRYILNICAFIALSK